MLFYLSLLSVILLNLEGSRATMSMAMSNLNVKLNGGRHEASCGIYFHIKELLSGVCRYKEDKCDIIIVL